MKGFNYFQPTDIHFGSGTLSELGKTVRQYGTRCLVVTMPVDDASQFGRASGRAKSYLEECGLKVEHFDGVVPNPTTSCISQGAEIAKHYGADVIVGLGGGSSMDVAKAIAVEATHPGTAWDYRWCSQSQPTEKTLPIVVVATTAGTGSEVTQVAVLTNPNEKDKSAIYNSRIYPKAAIVDPELMLTLPPHVTASTGFDAFTHAFESSLHPNASPYTDLLAFEAIRLVVKYLHRAVEDREDLKAREGMAWANTLAGLCIANAGVTLPHGIGMTIGGYAPQVMHGEALAVTYPEFTRFTYPFAVEQFAIAGRIFDPSLNGEPKDVAAEKACEAIDAFLKKIGMWMSLKSMGITLYDVEVIADKSRVLPDYKNNPRIADRDQIFEMLARSYDRL